MKASTLIRFALDAWLLWVIFHHAHWSVGAVCTIVIITGELNALLLADIYRRLGKLEGR
jgi:hypothetical protein